MVHRPVGLFKAQVGTVFKEWSNVVTPQAKTGSTRSIAKDLLFTSKTSTERYPPTLSTFSQEAAQLVAQEVKV
jgi:hypothetical protein